METQPSFADWIHRVRAGDPDAASDLVRQYERAVRVAVRVKLTDPRLRTHFDSMDVCQSVLASFFVRAAAGQFDLSNPQQLVGLLVKMAQNKLLMQARRHRQRCRDVGRVEATGDDPPPIRDPAPGPLRHAAAREMLSNLYDRLEPNERLIAERRGQGLGWAEIAKELNEEPDAVRMRFTRAINRVAPALGLDDGSAFDEISA